MTRKIERECALTSKKNAPPVTDSAYSKYCKTNSKAMMNLLMQLVLFVCCFELISSTSPFYVDNGLSQTVVLDTVPRREKRELQQEILTLLGLHHRPKPVDHFAVESAPRFMMDLYETLSNKDDGTDNDVEFHSNNTIRLNFDSSKVEGSDVIMSFVNHGKNYYGFFDLLTGKLSLIIMIHLMCLA